MRRRPLAFVLVVGTFFSLLAAAHRYFIVRLVHEPAFPSLAAWCIGAAGASIVVHPILDRRFGPAVGRVLGFPAHLWLATCFYLLLALGASDLLIAVLDIRGPNLARTRAVSVIALTLCVLGFGIASALRLPRVKRVTLDLPGWPAQLDGYTVVQLSDVHIGTLIGKRFVERITARVNALRADLVAITGDLVDGRVRHLAGSVAPLSDLHGTDGVFFVTGNHDYYSGATAWCAQVEALGITVLRNRRVTVQRHDASFELAGIDDYSSRGRCAEDLDSALEGWDGRAPLVLLAHDPRAFEHAHRRGALLQLSGHTHGGQIWPFSWLVRLQTRFVAGLYRLGNATLYVSRGTGFWGPPVRVLAAAEITQLVLRSASSEPDAARA